MQNNRVLIKKTDIIILVTLVLIISACSLFFSHNTKSAYAEVYINGALIETCKLDTDTEIPLFKDEVIITVKDGGVCISESDCHDKVCVRTGTIHSKYQTIVCLPNKLIVKIADDNTYSNEIDVIM